MKKIFAILAVCFALLNAPSVQAQVSININLQPSWGPSGYDYAEYYYIPELNIYYDVVNALFYYTSGSSWISSKFLPLRYKRYDLSTMYKVVLNGEPTPWLNNKAHKKTYKNYKNDRTQVPIRQTADAKHEPARNNTQPWVDNKPKTDATSTKTPQKPANNSSKKETNSTKPAATPSKQSSPAKTSGSSSSKPATSTTKKSSGSTSKSTSGTTKKSSSSTKKSSGGKR